MKKISIKRNGKGDTRTSGTLPPESEVRQASLDHIDDVRRVMNYISKLLLIRANKHDFTKIQFSEKFYENMKNTMIDGMNFKDGEWFKIHVTEERHHPNDYCHEDIDLLDLIEMCVDVNCAAKARSGTSPKNVRISNETLRKAFYNTIKLIDNITYIEEGG